MRNPGLEEAQAGIKIAGRNIDNLRYADVTTLMEESEEELKSLLMKVKEEREKVGLKLNIQKTKIMASGPITFSFRGRKVTTNLDSILKSRDITLPTKVRLVKAMVFPVIMYGCESWTVKKAESRKIDSFELWCWRRLLRVPWTARRSNQCILKEISPGCSLEGLMLKLELQYFGHLMPIIDSLEKTLMLRGIGGRRRGQQRMRWLDGLTSRWSWVWVNSRHWWWTGRPGVLWLWGRKVSDRTEWLNWLNWKSILGFPGVSHSKEYACNTGDLGLIPGSRRSPGEGNGNLLQNSCLENSMERRACWSIAHGVANSWTWLSE